MKLVSQYETPERDEAERCRLHMHARAERIEWERRDIAVEIRLVASGIYDQTPSELELTIFDLRRLVSRLQNLVTEMEESGVR